ncbi:MAG: S24 family peptidase [Pyrinomonadaceae bacterium]
MLPRTRKQRIVFDFINEFAEENGHTPTYKQIADHLGVKSRAGILRYISALEKQGLLKRMRGDGHFALTIDSGARGAGSCGIDWFRHPFASEYPVPSYDLTVPRPMLGRIEPEKIIAFIVENDAMKDAHIREGDIALIEKRSFVRDNDCVLAATKDGETAFGLYKKKGTKTEFHPSNSMYDIERHSSDLIAIVGLMRGLLRPFS